MRFVKAHGAGNDFVLLPDPAGRLALTPSLARALAAPHLGLGADGVIRIAPAGDASSAHAFMDYRNADGSVSDMCGNGIRCIAKYLVDRGLVEGTEVLIDTRCGVKRVSCERGAGGRVDRASLAIGEPVPLKVDLALEVEGWGTVHATTLSLGNPHAVIVVDDLAAAPVRTLGPLLEHHEEFPEGTNVEFLRARSRSAIEGRIWERGVGETLSSSSGASALAAAASLLDLADRHLTLAMPGGTFQTDWDDDGIRIAGPVVEVAEGEVDDAWLAAVMA
jgi:diaminopimelate epimerase